MIEQIVTKDKTITAESVALASTSSGLVLIALEKALGGDFVSAKNTIEKAYVEGEYNLKTTFSDIYDRISELDIDLQLKIRLYQKLAETEANVKLGGDPVIQLVGYASWIWIAPHLPSCPVLVEK